MPLVCLKCPNCGGDIQLDDSRDFGFCVFCGTKVMMEKKEASVKVDRGAEIVNLLKIARIKAENQDYDGVMELAEKVMFIDVDVADVWYLKALCNFGKQDDEYQNCLKQAAVSARSLGVFGEEDMRRCGGHMVRIRFTFESKNPMKIPISNLSVFLDGKGKTYLNMSDTRTIGVTDGLHKFSFAVNNQNPGFFGQKLIDGSKEFEIHGDSKITVVLKNMKTIDIIME